MSFISISDSGFIRRLRLVPLFIPVQVLVLFFLEKFGDVVSVVNSMPIRVFFWIMEDSKRAAVHKIF